MPVGNTLQSKPTFWLKKTLLGLKKRLKIQNKLSWMAILLEFREKKTYANSQIN